jgi:hypothetical protein
MPLVPNPATPENDEGWGIVTKTRDDLGLWVEVLDDIEEKDGAVDDPRNWGHVDKGQVARKLLAQIDRLEKEGKLSGASVYNLLLKEASALAMDSGQLEPYTRASQQKKLAEILSLLTSSATDFGKYQPKLPQVITAGK